MCVMLKSVKDVWGLFGPSYTQQPLQPEDYLTVCGNCGKPSEDHVKCDSCGYMLPAETLPLSTVTTLPPRPSVRSQLPSLQINRSFYEPTSGGCSQQLDVIINPSVRITHGNMLLPHNGRPVATSGSSACNGHKQAGGKKQQVTKPCELNDPSKYITLQTLTSHITLCYKW